MQKTIDRSLQVCILLTYYIINNGNESKSIFKTYILNRILSVILRDLSWKLSNVVKFLRPLKIIQKLNQQFLICFIETPTFLCSLIAIKMSLSWNKWFVDGTKSLFIGPSSLNLKLMLQWFKNESSVLKNSLNNLDRTTKQYRWRGPKQKHWQSQARESNLETGGWWMCT